ncbi:DUF305 domain-containing protein [Sphingomicrobium lutaoense]|uniref:Uncharacterized protein (DUF305 family) n=1 Tax=Sphingomicrobium lutaoense TaxID=515949 RepID=A0A839YYQ8_9SPHN|nr:DUF305 domain-containing protein [Sphingomicrobium lutaoense]MBB3763458.1 uncharacterized protein (DUF305 family) [Sphingomicrobium lutaoense]
MRAQNAPIILPGAPGDASKEISADAASRIADTRHSLADIQFLQSMIPHHAQASRMAALVDERTNNPDIVEIAGRISKGQDDEIAFMREWLTDHGASTDGTHAMHHMKGMASDEDMARLAAARGGAFDRLFLDLMIAHHEGAIEMVEWLREQPGTAYDPVLFEFISDVENDQSAEITRMNRLLAGLSPDPRSTLAVGFRDAGTAISNLELVAALPKPAGFFDPANPAQLPARKPKKDEDAEKAADPDRGDEGVDEDSEWHERSPLLSFSQTDMAFSGDHLFVGNYHGFNIYRMVKGAAPQLVTSVVCPGGQGDVSVVGNLLIMSVEQTRARRDCGQQGVMEDISPNRFRGIRIFDISDIRRPRQVGQVQTCRGSHTHSVVDSNDERLLVYVSGTGSVRDGKELEGCVGDVPGDQRTSLFSIDVVEIPLANPAAARIVSSPRVFEQDGQIAGLWRGGDHGEGTQSTYRTDMCHDITIFPTAKLAAGACSGNGILLDISDPMNPRRIDAVTDKGFAYWHSATFNNDGTKVLFTDEWGGGGRPRCRASDPRDWGADAIYDIVDGKLEFRSYFKLPAPQSDEENCVAHNGSVVPVPGRDIFVQSWYQGGLSIIDFTDSEKPFEIAYFDRGPVHADRLVMGGYWSSYYNDGLIYATEIARGLDVFALKPSEHLSENEIAAAALADTGESFNPQQQFPVTWPAHPTVAKAYVDQLERSGALTAAQAERLRAGADSGDAARLSAVQAEIAALSLEGQDARRAKALAAALAAMAADRR